MSRLSGLLGLLAAPLLALLLAPQLDALVLVMLALVTFIAVVIHSYARRYLDGQAAAARFERWFLATIAATSLLVTAGDLRLLAVAWTLSSLSLHQLLTFFSDRQPAQVAAHKKFLLSRLADVAIYTAVALLGRAFGSYDLSVINAQASALANLPATAHAAGYLLVAGVALRSAQLPFHGWLIQVMEAPTPVSALLHAGVVNIGGYLLLRLASLVEALPGMELALVLVGGSTAVLAALVTMTRVSIKVALAWSTAAQMGFMLLECGLGAWELALLHIVAHSCYKAYAFLGSGGVVATHVQRQLAAPHARPTLLRWIAAAVGGSLVAAIAGWVAWPTLGTDPRAWIAVTLLALAITPFFVRVDGALPPLTNAGLVGSAVLVATLYAAWHVAFGALVPRVSAPPPVMVVFAALGAFLTLFLVQVLVSARPTSRAARTLQAWAFAGFHLDEGFTRLTFLVWPPRHVRRAQPAPAARMRSAVERAA
ncbi:MAG: NADH-quinone oxidoreductase subunit L [Gemmatimonadetes bacterium]|nr:NADH-quinone oxidoreductase subunit L [Gemmatimonadota bacterium]